MSRPTPDRSDLTANAAVRSTSPGSATGEPTRRRRTAARICADDHAAPPAPVPTERPARRPAPGHDRAYFRSQSQGGKAARSGANGEQRVDDLLTELGLHPQAKSRITGARLSGKAQILDNACYVPELEGLVKALPTTAGKVNVVVSVKTQQSRGSAEQKLAAEIDDLSDFSDKEGLPAVLVLNTPVFTAGQMRELRARAEEAAIAILTVEELRAGKLPLAAMRIHALREPLRNAAVLADLNQLRRELSPVQRGWMKRQDIRDAVSQATN